VLDEGVVADLGDALDEDSGAVEGDRWRFDDADNEAVALVDASLRRNQRALGFVDDALDVAALQMDSRARVVGVRADLLQTSGLTDGLELDDVGVGVVFQDTASASAVSR
jgi:hypothetical protein